MKTSNVCIFIPWRDRAWILPYTLENITNLDYPKENIGLRFIVNDSKDETFKLLMNFKKKYHSQYRFISIWTFNMGSIKDERTAEVRKKTIWNMALLKNIACDALSKKDEFLLYMDSDILLRPDTVKLLVDADKDFIAGICKTGKGDIYNFLMRDSHFDRYTRMFDHSVYVNSPVPVKMDLVAGIQLMRYWITKKIRFYQENISTTSEDAGAMKDLMNLEVERWLHPRAIVDHIMSKEELDIYIQNHNNKDLDLEA